MATMRVRIGAGALENEESDIVKTDSDLSEEIGDLTISLGEIAGDNAIPTTMAPLGGDTRGFAIFRLRDVFNSARTALSPSSQTLAAKYLGWHEVVMEIQGKLRDAASTSDMKRQMFRIQPFPQTLSTLIQSFETLVVPFSMDFGILWVIKSSQLSYNSREMLKRLGDLFNTIRSITARFNRCLSACDDNNEALLAIIDFLDPIATILSDSITYLHGSSSEQSANLTRPDLNEAINTQLDTLEEVVRHIKEITNLSKANQDRMVRSLVRKYALLPESDEPGVFPNRMIPFQKNSNFYGREEELKKIEDYLTPKGNPSLRTYTIYGRRGIGKTEIALQFAHENRAGFDALFWIQCETSVAIRQSFTNAAVSLNLPEKKWLMIFDNTEQDQVLKAYWPIGASGAILITSRKYRNFSKDLQRKGGTVKPFNLKESWDLLLQLLGDDWKKYEREGRIPQTEVTAAKEMLDKLEGLPLAIQQAAILIQDPTIGGLTIVKTYELFKERRRTLPERHRSVRSLSEQAIDALWNMSFEALSPNARTLLGVLAWLSPDAIQVELFLPRHQKALDIVLSFCRTDTVHLDENDQASLFSIMSPAEPFEEAMNQLVDRKLVKQEGRFYSVHRVVQEAVNYHDADDLQNSFVQAATLIYEQFPKQTIATLYKEWKVCQDYIPHGVYISKKFSEHVRSGALKSTDAFVTLLGNCAWYLREIGDFDVCSEVVETAAAACVDKNSLLYARLKLIQGNIAFDLNRLTECRTAWDITKRIRTAKLPHDDPAGNLQEARNYFDRAVQIWAQGGDETATTLAFTYLSAGRMHMLQGNLLEAMNLTQLAETLFIRTIGGDKGFMAKCGWLTMYLDKARSIAELRSPTRDDGVVARICWKTAIVLESDTFGTFKTEADEFRSRAEVARQRLISSGEVGIVPFVQYDIERDSEEKIYDALVPIFYR
ncbi:hypothetical protein BGZ57DRAFT_1009101 [Hyaloscypha finlandica]|nr:hypothetical protein BGZ57DRAFT_1009101 [Hyaloscypha finlandica]